MKINYTIGDDIVALRDHSLGRFKAGDVFKCFSLTMSKCKCSIMLVDIGLSSIKKEQKCLICYNVRKSEKIAWYKSTSFKKLDFDISELTEILEKENQKEIKI